MCFTDAVAGVEVSDGARDFEQTVVGTHRELQLRGGTVEQGIDVGIGVQLGGWWRLFRDADPALFNRSAISEGALSVRPMVFLGDVAGVAVDLSYQALQTTAIDERTGAPEGGGVFKLGLMPYLSPFGRGTYTRPQIRLMYVLTARHPLERICFRGKESA